MIAEFFEFDETALWHGVTGRQFALIPFCIGAGILAWHYLGRLLAARTASLGNA